MLVRLLSGKVVEMAASKGVAILRAGAGEVVRIKRTEIAVKSRRERAITRARRK